MAEHTLGRRLVERRPVVKIFGEKIPLKAQVAIMNGFSAHADRNELLAYFEGLEKQRLRRVFIVHGEPEQSKGLAEAIREKSWDRVSIPERGDRVEV
jgi:metallo-beta-lactamase family protein